MNAAFFAGVVLYLFLGMILTILELIEVSHIPRKLQPEITIWTILGWVLFSPFILLTKFFTK